MAPITVSTPEEAFAEIEAVQERRRRGEDLAEEAARLSGDLRAFIRAAWHVLEPVTPYSSNWHVDAIADHLEAAYDRDIRRLLINVPPGSMKSLIVSVFGPAWLWTTRPEERFLTASYGEKLATRDSVKTRRLITSSWYRSRWFDWRLTSDQNVKTRYENDRSGYRIATSVGGTGTGERASIIKIDDPHNAEEILSDTQRQSVIEWHDGTISTRFNDPKTSVEIIIMQRLHEEDLAGHVLEQGGWTHLILPAEYEPKLLVRLPGGDSVDVTAPQTVELPSGRELLGDPRTEPGELLHPDRNPPAEHERTKTTMGSYKAAGQLQQRPAPAEGGILKTGWWRYFPPDWLESWRGPEMSALLTFWDTTLKEKTTSDFCVGTVWAACGANRYLLRKVRGQMGLPETKLQVRNTAAWVEEMYPGVAHRIKVENAANGPEVVAQLRDRVSGLSLWSPGDKGDKVQRAHAVSPELEAGQVFVPGKGLPDGTGPDPTLTPAWVQELIAECSAFNNGAHDDQVDSFTGALLNLRGSFSRSEARAADDDADPDLRRALTAGIREKTF